MDLKALPESSIEHLILNYLATSGAGFFWKNVTGGYFDGQRFRKQASPFAINGVSDIIGILKDGRFVALEVKTAKGRTSQAQDAFLSKARSLHAVCGVVRSPEDAFRVLQAHGVACEAPRCAHATSK